MKLTITVIFNDNTFQTKHTQTHKQVVTRENETPDKKGLGIVSERKQYELTTPEQAENFIVRSVLSCTKDDETAKVSSFVMI